MASWGGAGRGQGRKRCAVGERVESVVLRVPARLANVVKDVIGVLRVHPSAEEAILRSAHHPTDKSSTEYTLLVERMVCLEDDATARIADLERQLCAVKSGGDEVNLRVQIAQLSSELFPALKRLREIDSAGEW